MLPRQCLAVVTRRTLELLQCHEASQRALDVVVDLLERFLEETGRRAAQYRDLASRQAGTFVDVAHALRDLGMPLESFARRLKEQPLVKHSGLEREWPLPLRRPLTDVSLAGLPRFPVDPALELPPALVVDEEGPEAPFPEEAPAWLPPLPPRHSYVHTPVPAAVPLPAEAQARMKTERRLQVEGYLERLQKRPRESEGEAVAEEADAGAAARKLAKPLPPTIDQAWADAHALREVRGARMQVEQGAVDEDENEYQLRLKAEAIVAGRNAE